MNRWKFFFSSLAVNYAPAGDGAGGGGGSGDGEGAAPDVISDAVRELVIQTTNAAITSQLGRKLGPAIQQGMASAMQPIQEQLTAALEKVTPATAPAPGAPNANPEIAALQLQNENMQKQLTAEKDARESSIVKGRETTRNSAMQNALAAAGVEPLRMRGAMAEIVGNVKIADDGQAFFRSNAKGYDEDSTLESGISAWAQTDIGKAYLSPKQVAGSGAQQHGQQAAQGQQQQQAGTKEERVAQARAGLPSLVAQMVGGGGGGIRFGGNDEQ